MTVSIYGSIAAFKQYRLDHGVTVDPADTDAEIAASLLVASEYIDDNYRGAFPGNKTGLRPQVREWPRAGAYDINWQPIAPDEIPREVEAATYEATWRDLASPGSLRTDVTLGTAISQATVFGAVSVTYEGVGQASDAQVQIPQIDAILAPILTGVGYGAVSSLSARTTRVQ